MEYEEDFELPTKKINLNKENDCTPAVEPRRIIIKKDEETKVRSIRKRRALRVTREKINKVKR
jgi:hypothetical protein